MPIWNERPAPERFWEKVEITETCWLWTAFTQSGYGQFTFGSARTVRAHRWAYEHLVGPIPAGLTLDHLCHNEDASCPGGVTCPHRRCVNPDHLEPATKGANVLRSRNAPSAINARKTHCKYGHPFDLLNTRFVSSGRRKRVCRTCERAKFERLQARAK